LLALRPDCVVYNPKWPNISDLVQILESGNVVTTAAFITGGALLPDDRQTAHRCMRSAATSIFGTGMNPGMANLLGIVSAESATASLDHDHRVGRLDRVRLARDRAARRVRARSTIPACRDDEAGTKVFGGAVRLVVGALGLGSIPCCEAECAQTTRIDLGSWSIPAGCVAGSIELEDPRRAGGREARRSVAGSAPRTRLEGRARVHRRHPGPACVRTKLEIYPAADFVAKSFSDYMVLGMIMTRCRRSTRSRTCARSGT
jgi:hypothetical protein